MKKEEEDFKNCARAQFLKGLSLSSDDYSNNQNNQNDQNDN